MINKAQATKIGNAKRKLCKKLDEELIDKNEDMRYRAFICKLKRLRQKIGGK